MVDPVCADLATKAELQELRDQLNAALGGKEDGGTETIFASGKTTTAVTAGIGLTLLGMAKTNAPKAITDITLEVASEKGLWRELQAGTAKLLTFKGNGTKVPSEALEKLGKVAGQAQKTGKVAGKMAGQGSAALMVLAQLATIAATLALNIATVKVLDKRIDAEAKGTQLALDALNNSHLRLYQKHQGDIDKVNADIEANNAITEQNRRDIDDNRNDINKLKQNDAIQQQNIDTLLGQVATLQNENLELRSEIADLNFELGEVQYEFEEALDNVERQLEEANKIIETQQQQLQEQQKYIEDLETRLDEYEARIGEYEQLVIDLRTDFDELKGIVDEIVRLNPDLLAEPLSEEPTEEEFTARWTTIQETEKEWYKRYQLEKSDPNYYQKRGITVIDYETNFQKQERARKYEQELLRTPPFRTGSTAKYGAAAAQTGILEIADRLAPDTNINTQINVEDLQDGSKTFKERLALYLDTITPNKEMTPEELQQIKTTFEGLLGTTVIPRLDDIQTRTSERKIADAVQTGICESMNAPNQCSVPGVDNPKQGLKGGFDGLNALLNGADLLQNSAIGKAVDRIDKTVHHKTWGLEAVQKWGEKAWKATHADKILNALTTVMVIHNAAMLSGNIALTVGETASLALKVVGIQNSDGSAIDVNNVVGNKIKAMIVSILGANNYAALTKKIAAANRIYQAGSNVISTVRSIQDSAYNMAETTGDNVAAIGNALKKAGVVRENAYALMPDVSADYNKSRLLNKLDKIDTVSDALSSITMDAVDIKEEVTNFKENKKEFDDALADSKKEFNEAEIKAKAQETQSAEPTEEDEARSVE